MNGMLRNSENQMNEDLTLVEILSTMKISSVTQFNHFYFFFHKSGRIGKVATLLDYKVQWRFVREILTSGSSLLLSCFSCFFYFWSQFQS